MALGCVPVLWTGRGYNEDSLTEDVTAFHTLFSSPGCPGLVPASAGDRASPLCCSVIRDQGQPKLTAR